MTEEKRMLILFESAPNDWTLNAWRNNDIFAEIQFRQVNKVLRGIRRGWVKSSIPFEQIWYGDWKKRIKNIDVFIIHISGLNKNLPRYINRVNPKARVIAWYWNIVDNNTLPSDIKGNCELWSFDPGDCSRYGMHFNHQYYFKSLVLPAQVPIWDVYFVGNDHGRSKAILSAWAEFSKPRFKSLFQVVSPLSKEIPKEIISPYLSYDTIRENISKSCAILELVKEGQTGATLRVMEAVFFQRKLITNNPHVKEEPFYNPQNIFILGERPYEELDSFLHSPLTPYSESVLNQYDVKQWLDNFIEYD